MYPVAISVGFRRHLQFEMDNAKVLAIGFSTTWHSLDDTKLTLRPRKSPASDSPVDLSRHGNDVPSRIDRANTRSSSSNEAVDIVWHY